MLQFLELSHAPASRLLISLAYASRLLGLALLSCLQAASSILRPREFFLGFRVLFLTVFAGALRFERVAFAFASYRFLRQVT